MKRILSFIILTSLFVFVLSLPSHPTPPHHHHPYPIWSALCFLAVVCLAGVTVWILIKREQKRNCVEIPQK